MNDEDNGQNRPGRLDDIRDAALWLRHPGIALLGPLFFLFAPIVQLVVWLGLVLTHREEALASNDPEIEQAVNRNMGAPPEAAGSAEKPWLNPNEPVDYLQREDPFRQARAEVDRQRAIEREQARRRRRGVR